MYGKKDAEKKCPSVPIDPLKSRPRVEARGDAGFLELQINFVELAAKLVMEDALCEGCRLA